MSNSGPPPAAVDPSAPVAALGGVGPGLSEKLARLGVARVWDLLFLLPLRYQDRTRVLPMGALTLGAECVVEGQVEHTELVSKRRKMLLVRISDGTGVLLLRFFYFSAKQQQQFKPGTAIRCFGEVRTAGFGYEMVHPEYRLTLGADEAVTEVALTPVYPSTEGLNQQSLRKLTQQALECVESIPDHLPDWLRVRQSFPTLATALRMVHRPPPEVALGLLAEGLHPAQRRLAFEELLGHHLSLLKIRESVTSQPAPRLRGGGELAARFLSALPFALTTAQRRVADEIEQDLGAPHPMLRLVQGDVGSGKTVVAALAGLVAVEAGSQVAIMAPTEILAEQHLANFQRWFEPLGVAVVAVTGKLRAGPRRAALEALASGAARVAVGTHALFQDDVEFASLALVIVDEQHRFGVHQRLALREKGARGGLHPHQLIMTATPIPRTLAMTAYADLDLSVIDEKPPGRQPVTTVAMPAERRAEIVARVAEAARAGRQCYWVCTLVEESEALQCEAAEATHAALAMALPELRLGLVHGRQKPAEKADTMRAFQAGEIQLLVATTVIEVGVDVPNATLMIIEDADRLGLSQLHQLRGRIGRGAGKSSCVLLYQPPLSQAARVRLKAMRETEDGFRIARIDLELRGPGEVLGTRQTGMLQFRIADLMRDREMIPDIQDAAKTLLAREPERAQALIERWIGAKAQYRQV